MPAELHRRSPTLPLLAGLLGMLSCTALAVASDASYQKILQGFAQLKQGNDSSALQQFQAAVATDPHDPQAWLFEGTAFNQLGQPGQALQALNCSADLGCQDPEILFQTGRAHLLLGQNNQAIYWLLEFEAKKPGRGQTSEFLGRAYTTIGDYPKAQAAFEQALNRDPNLRSTVLPYQAQLAKLRNDRQTELQSLDDLRWFAPESETARVLRNAPVLPEDEASNSPLKYSIGISGGYNTDVQGVEVISVQGDTFGRSAAFDETTLSGSYTWTGLSRTDPAQDPDTFTISAAALWDDFPGVTQGDFISTLASGEYHRHLIGPLSGSLKLSGEYDALSYRGFRDSIVGRAAVQWRVTPRLLLEGAYTGAGDSYLYDPAPVQNPDSISNTYSVDGYLRLSPADISPEKSLDLRLGGFFVTSRAKGSDFDFNGDGAVAGLDFPLIQHIRAHLLYSLSDDRYLNLNSLTIDPDAILLPPTYRREDYLNAISLKLTRQMREWNRHLTVSAGFEFNRNSSNIPAYKFSQQIVSFGLDWDS